MKKYFFTGFITLLPLALTLIIVQWLFNLFTDPLAGLTEWLIVRYESSLHLQLEQHHTLVLFLSRVIAFIILVALILLLGFCGQKFLSRYFVRFNDRLFARIPFVRMVYRLSKDITKAIFSDTQNAFKYTVLIPFPHDQAVAIGFVTGDVPEAFKKGRQLDLAVFVPTAPHPLSGFVLMMPKSLVLPVDVSIEEAFKFLISAGVLHPGEKPPSDNK